MILTSSILKIISKFFKLCDILGIRTMRDLSDETKTTRLRFKKLFQNISLIPTQPALLDENFILFVNMLSQTSSLSHFSQDWMRLEISGNVS